MSLSSEQEILRQEILKKGNISALRRTLELISDPEIWMKGNYFYIEEFNCAFPETIKASFPEVFPVSKDSDKKCQMCLMGAWRWACYEARHQPEAGVDSTLEYMMEECIKEIKPVVRDYKPVHFNDHQDTTHDDVVKAVECTIKREEARV